MYVEPRRLEVEPDKPIASALVRLSIKSFQTRKRIAVAKLST
jgi:hypothetical protein